VGLLFICNFFVTSASFLVIVYFLFGLVVNWVVHFLCLCLLLLFNRSYNCCTVVDLLIY